MRSEGNYDGDAIDSRQQERLDDVLHPEIVGAGPATLDLDDCQSAIFIGVDRIRQNALHAVVALLVEVRHLRVTLARFEIPPWVQPQLVTILAFGREGRFESCGDLPGVKSIPLRPPFVAEPRRDAFHAVDQLAQLSRRPIRLGKIPPRGRLNLAHAAFLPQLGLRRLHALRELRVIQAEVS